MTARGYEIHDGETSVACAPGGTIGGKPDGAACGNVFGTYLHGPVSYTHLFGGVTGDLAGWFLQWAELAMLAMLVTGGMLL